MRYTDNSIYGGFDYQGEKNNKTGFLRFLTVFLPILIVLVFAGGITMGYIATADKINTPNKIEPTDSQKELSLEEKAELLRIVNTANPLESDFVPKLSKLESIQISETALDSLKSLMTAAQKENVSLVLESGYIPFDEQQKMYENKKQELMTKNGYTDIKAESLAKKTIPKGGESEAQTGLLVTFSTDDKSANDFESSRAYLWLQKNCIRYGFTERYTSQGEKYTGMSKNPKAFRFVGRDNAVRMRSYNMCLEQYVRHIAQE
ncbi:MAG: M15 family metallopeptidase [Acutalibacteraceae bacterium]